MNFKASILKSPLPLVIILSIGLNLCTCINREKAEENNEISASEVSMSISTRPTNPFISDSAYVVVDSWGAPNMWFLSISAFEFDSLQNIFSFTAIGISFPGTLNIDTSTTYGAASYFASDGKIYRTQLPGGSGTLHVMEFEEQVRIAGTFDFTLIDTSNGDILQVENGQFDAQIDESPYINPR